MTPPPAALLEPLQVRPWHVQDCPHCPGRVRTRVRGRSIQCKGCRRYVYVPAEPTTSPDSAVPATTVTITTQSGQVRPVTDDAIAGHVQWMRGRGLAENTVRARALNLMALAGRYWPRPLLDLTHEDLFGWQLEQMARVAPGTVRALLVDARQFYRWAVREEITTLDPTTRLDLPRVPRRAPRPIAEARLHRAMDAATPPVRLMLALAAYAGARACEVAALTWSDVDEDAETLTLRGKGGHHRVVPLAPPVAVALEELREHYRSMGLTVARGPVLRNGHGRPGHVPAHHVSHHANRHLRACEVRDTYHSLRHRFGTQVYAATRDIKVTQTLLGHASVLTTEVYVGVNMAGARDAVLAAATGTTGATPTTTTATTECQN